MLELASKSEAAASYIRERWAQTPKFGLILGTGLGNLATQIDSQITIPYSAIPYFPTTTALSHKGRLVCGQLQSVDVVAMQGRFHLYEG